MQIRIGSVIDRMRKRKEKLDVRSKTSRPHTTNEGTRMNISEVNELQGFIGACLVDSDTGLMLASEGGGKLDLEAASALNTQVVKAKLAAIEALKLDDQIEDILISLGKQYHLIRPLAKNPTMFLYTALDRKTANLGMARIKVKAIESNLKV
jgi:predicted regulator of Ras-like GTPase activity (Roadblock/LC7/MglB family)